MSEVIPRRVLFGNPTKASPKISPDGTRLAYLANSEKAVLNVYVKTVGQDDDKMVTNDEKRGIRMFGWAENNTQLFYFQDNDGDENFHVYAVDLGMDVVRDLTPFQGTKAQNFYSDRKFPNQVLCGLNLQDRTMFDVYRIDLTTGAVVLDTKNPGDVINWITDFDFQIRAAVATDNETGATIVRVRDDVESAWRELMRFPFEENGEVHEFNRDGTGLYIESSIGSDTTRMILVSTADGSEREQVGHDTRCDVGELLFNHDTFTVQESHSAMARLCKNQFYLVASWFVLNCFVIFIAGSCILALRSDVRSAASQLKAHDGPTPVLCRQ